MVKFGKFLKSVRRAKWSGHYFNYKLFRTLLRAVTVDQEVQRKFFHHFDNEVHKIANFSWSTAIESKTALARLSSQLPAPIETLVLSLTVNTACQYAYQVVALAKEVRELAMFMDINLVALHKVLKKYNKKSKSLAAHEYVQARRAQTDSLFNKLWDTKAIESFANDLGAIAAKMTLSMDKYAGLDQSELLLEHSEMIEILGEQIDETVSKVHLNMPLERYMTPVVESTGAFDTSGLHLTYSDQLAICVLALYCANYYIGYAEGRAYCHQLGLPYVLLGAELSATPFFALIVTICHGYMRDVDYKLPIIYSILMCVIGNALYAVALMADSSSFMLIGRAFFGLGDPTLLLLFYFAGSVGGHLKHRWHVKLLFLMLAGYSFSWLLQGLFRALPLKGDIAAYNIGSFCFAFLWAIVLIPFRKFFKTPISISPRFRLDLPASSDHLHIVLIALLTLFLSTLISEAYVIGVVVLAKSEWLPVVLLAATAVGAVSLVAIPRQERARPILILLEAATLATFLLLKLMDHHTAFTELQAVSQIPLFLLQVFMGLGFALIIKRMKTQAPRVLKRNLLQAGYTVVLAGRVAGCMLAALAGFAGDETLLGHLFLATAVTCAALLLLTACSW